MSSPVRMPRRNSAAVWWAPGVVIFGLLCIPLVFGGNREAVLAVAIGTSALAAATTILAARRARNERHRYEAQLTAWVGERAAQSERLRLARDLHDLVSHNLGLVTVRAASALHVGERAGERDALVDIERIGREAMAELRRMLAVLRESEDQPLPHHPADTFDTVPTIIDEARGLGLDINLDMTDVHDAGAGVQLAVCRVIREGLANAVRHAGPTTVDIGIHREGGWIVTSVRDEGPLHDWVPLAGTRHGLAALREQVTALGGQLGTKSVENGFELLARLPDGPAT